MVIAALLVIPLLVLEQSSSPATRQVAVTLNWVVWLAFVAEAVIMLAIVRDRVGWLKHHPLEVAVILLTAPVLPASLQALRALRLLRLFRLLLLAKRIRGLITPGGLSHAAVFGIIVVVAGGVALRVVEPQLDLTVGDGMWWALTTATTVGYGDIVPASYPGRAIAGVVMLVGVGFVALLTAALARVFVSDDDTVEQEILAAMRAMEQRLSEMEGLLRLRGEDVR